MPRSVGTKSMLPLSKSPSTTSGLPMMVALLMVMLLMYVIESIPGSYTVGGRLLIIHRLWSSAKASASLAFWTTNEYPFHRFEWYFGMNGITCSLVYSKT